MLRPAEGLTGQAPIIAGSPADRYNLSLFLKIICRTMTETTLIYGVPFSQPVRALVWLMLYKQKPFRLVPVNPGSSGENGSRHPSFLAKNPAGTIPLLEEPETGFILAEAHAIMTYLARKNGWSDVYPADPAAAASVDWYLHYHHRNLREASVGLVAPSVRKDLKIPESMQKAAAATLSRALQVLETGWLSGSRFLAGESLTLADFAAYVEIGQLQPQFTNLFDFSPFPNIRRWMQELAETPGHDEAHRVLSELGDISSQVPSMEHIIHANKVALGSLRQHLEAGSSKGESA